MLERTYALRSGTAHVRFTGRSEGDLVITGPAGALASRRAAVAPGPWTWLRQVHGARVVRVESPGAHAGEEADGAVTDVPGAVLAVHTADCAPIALLSPDGVVGAVHAGWKGLADGVVAAGVSAMRDLGASSIEAVLGPCIRPECYEFGAADLDRLAAQFGDAVRGTTAGGRPALDLPAAVTVALAAEGVAVEVVGGCTACSDEHWSHRARSETERQALAVWFER